MINMADTLYEVLYTFHGNIVHRYIYASSMDDLALKVSNLFRSRITKKVNLKSMLDNIMYIITAEEAKLGSKRAVDIYEITKKVVGD